MSGAPGPTACPTCGSDPDITLGVGLPPTPPRPGDWSICGHCGDIAVFTGEDNEVRACTSQERMEARADPGLQAVFGFLRGLRVAQQ